MSIKNQDSHALNYEMAQIQGQPEFTQFSELGPPRQFDFGPQMLTVGIIVFSVSQRGKFEVVQENKLCNQTTRHARLDRSINKQVDY